jgi:hypothetical protein
MRRLAAVLALTLVPVSACGGDEYDDYCGAVEEHQAELTEIRADGGPTALLGALDVFRDLRAEAPADIDDEWQQVVGRLEDLQDALDAAGVDAASYDRSDPPAGVGDDERAAIEAAARALVAPETATALEGLEQQARDVCKTPLSL